MIKNSEAANTEMFVCFGRCKGSKHFNIAGPYNIARDENGEVVKRPNDSDKGFILYSLSGEKSLKGFMLSDFYFKYPLGKAFTVSVANLTYRTIVRETS